VASSFSDELEICVLSQQNYSKKSDVEVKDDYVAILAWLFMSSDCQFWVV